MSVAKIKSSSCLENFSAFLLNDFHFMIVFAFMIIFKLCTLLFVGGVKQGLRLWQNHQNIVQLEHFGCIGPFVRYEGLWCSFSETSENILTMLCLDREFDDLV